MGRADGQHLGGVGLIMDEAIKSSLLEFQPISPRMVFSRFDSKFAIMTVLQGYAPTGQADRENGLCEIFQDHINNVTRHDVLIVIGDDECQGRHKE